MIITAFAIFGYSNAQEASFGVKAGLNLANIVGDNTDGDMRYSFHFGGIAEIPLSQDFVFGPEVLYSSQGIKNEFSEGSLTSKSELKLNYIQIPLMFKYFIADGFSLDFGPQVGFLNSAKHYFDVSDDGFSSSGSDNVKKFYSGFDFGINGGLGYRLENGLFFQGRYNIGLANILDADSDGFKAQNSVLQFSAGFMF